MVQKAFFHKGGENWVLPVCHITIRLPFEGGAKREQFFIASDETILAVSWESNHVSFKYTIIVRVNDDVYMYIYTVYFNLRKNTTKNATRFGNKLSNKTS